MSRAVRRARRERERQRWQDGNDAADRVNAILDDINTPTVDRSGETQSPKTRVPEGTFWNACDRAERTQPIETAPDHTQPASCASVSLNVSRDGEKNPS